MEDHTNLTLKETTTSSDYNTAISGDFFTPLSQTWSYGLWQKAAHHNIRNFIIQNDSEILGGFQLIQYPLPFKLSYLYIPHGPILKQGLSESEEKTLLSLLQEIAKRDNAIFIRIDFWPTNLKTLPTNAWQEAPIYSYHSAFFQPRFEWALDLNQTEQNLLAKMHPHAVII